MPNPQQAEDVPDAGAETGDPQAQGDQPPFAQPLRPEARGEFTPDNPGRLVGDDATATFDHGPSNPTERASSEALTAATRVDRDSTTADDADLKALNTEDADPDTDRVPGQP